MGHESRAKVTDPIDFERRKIQKLADRVRDEPHWQEILATSPTDAVRHELETVVGPILPHRRCQNRDCQTGTAGVWKPTLELRQFPGGPVSTCQIQRKVCAACRALTSLEDVLDDDGWGRIVEGLIAVGKYEPARELTTLVWEAVN